MVEKPDGGIALLKASQFQELVVMAQARMEQQLKRKQSAPSGGDAPPLAVAPFDVEQAKKHRQAWAEYLGLPVEFENSIGMKMVLVPPGEFIMGTQDEERQRLVESAPETGKAKELRTSEGPQHSVRLTDPFYMSIHEVTVGQFRQFAKTSGFETYGERGGGGLGPYDGKQVKRPEFVWHSPGFGQHDDHPVVQMSLKDAWVFCQWRSEKEVRRYAVPSEAQWEYACRAGSQDLWPFGDDKDELDLYAWFGGELTSPTHPVGLKQANAFGLFDTLGNAYEWTNDLYANDYYANSPSVNPDGPTEGERHVLRGGCFRNGPYTARPGTRCIATGPGTACHHWPGYQ